jgi:hypothetical protein
LIGDCKSMRLRVGVAGKFIVGDTLPTKANRSG